MRQGQQNRRGRGRNNNQNNQQRKGQNPLTRSFESNGPDVKLRGTPSHIAEKYMSLARDALSAGDPVLAENYLQHAEHYNRIIMAYREQQISQGAGDPGFGGFNGQGARGEAGFGGDLEAGDDGFETGDMPAMARPSGGEQPRLHEGGERRFEDRPQRTHNDQPRHQHQGPRDRDRDRSYQDNRGNFDRRDRHEQRGDRPDRDRPDRDRPERSFDRADRPERNEPRPDRERERPDRDRGEQRFERPQQAAGEPRGEGAPPRRRERPAGDRLPSESHEQPEFLRRPVRRPRRDDQDEGAELSTTPVVAASDDHD